MKTMYRTTWDGNIEERKILKETDKMVVYMPEHSDKPRRVYKTTDYDCWFNTVEEAEDHWLTLADVNVAKAEMMLFVAKERREKYRTMYGKQSPSE